MNLRWKIAHSVAKSPWTVIGSALASFGGLLVGVYQAVADIMVIITAGIIIAVVSIVGGYSIKVRADNRNLEGVADFFAEINAIYRDSLFSQFSGNQPPPREKLMEMEKATIASVCQRIARIYSELTGKDCTATVKLLMCEGDGELFAVTYARSENDSQRDRERPHKFEVNRGQNTAFDKALMNDTTGRIPHFYSGDLNKDYKHNEYQNQRSNWRRYYLSAIVVPIRCAGVDGNPTRDDIGLICVDTKSRNRLNNGHHVKMLAALADQMYNFMSIMRGKYKVPALEANRHAE